MSGPPIGILESVQGSVGKVLEATDDSASPNCLMGSDGLEYHNLCISVNDRTSVLGIVNSDPAPHLLCYNYTGGMKRNTGLDVASPPCFTNTDVTS